MGDALRQELARWGFSEAEIDVYVAILEMTDARISEVADRADVTSRHVYRIVERLEERGLVEVKDHLQPTMVRAADPDHVAAVIEDSQSTILERIEQTYTDPDDQIGDVDVLNHRPAVIDRCRAMIREAEEWLLLVARRSLVADLVDVLADAVDRGVLTLVVTEDGSDFEEYAFGDIASVGRVWPDLETWDEAGLGVDYFRSLYVMPREMGAAESGYSPAIAIEQQNLAPRVIGSLLGNEWGLGEERTVPDPVALPHTFDVFPLALVHATLHRRAGRSLVATVEATSTDTGEPTTLEGEVTDVLQGMVEPTHKTFSLERVLMVETDDGEVSVASPGATIEDYVARSVTLDAAD